MQQFFFYTADTSKSIDFFLADSGSTIGAGLGGLVHNTAGLKAYYRNTLTGTVTAISLVTQTVGGAWTSGGFVELDATNAKGMYRLDIPNAVLTNDGQGFIHFYGATNLVQTPIQINVGAVPSDIKRVQNSVSTANQLTRVFLTDIAANYTNGVGWVVRVGDHAAAALTAIALSVWGALTATYVTAGTFGKFLQDQLNATVGSRAAPGAQMDLVNAPNATALTAIGAKLEAMILDEGDATALLAAIAAKVETFIINEGDATATMAAIAAAVRTNLTTELARIDVVLSSRLATAGYTAPDNASIASTNTRVLLALPASAPDTNGGFITTNAMEDLLAQINTDIIDMVRAGIIADHGAGSYIRNTEPDNANILAGAASAATAATQATTAATQSTAAAADAVAAKIASQANKAILDKYDTMIVLDGAVWQYTVNALELAPSGGGGGSAPTVEEIEAHLASLHGSGQWDSITSGAGGEQCLIQLGENGAGAEVWVTSDPGGDTVVAGTLIADGDGDVTFLLDVGQSYYLWAQKFGMQSIQGQLFTATSD